MKKIKIIQIGVLHEHANGIITSLRKMPEVFDILGYVDDRSFSVTPTFGDYPGKYTEPYEGLRQMTLKEALNHPEVEAYTVEVPNNELVPMALRVLERGLPIHMDKPAGEDIELYAKLLDGCKERKVPFLMGFMFRGNPALKFCRQIVKDGLLGDVLEVEMDMSHDYGGDIYQEYISNFKGGIMYNLGCHNLDFIVALMGRPDRITPFMKTVQGTLPGCLNNTMAVLEYPNALVSVRVNCHKVHGTLHRRLMVAGSKGMFEICPIENIGGELKARLYLKEAAASYKAGDNIISFGIQEDRYVDHLNEFAQMIRGEIENPYTYEHDYLAHQVILAAAGYNKWSK